MIFQTDVILVKLNVLTLKQYYMYFSITLPHKLCSYNKAQENDTANV